MVIIIIIIIILSLEARLYCNPSSGGHCRSVAENCGKVNGGMIMFPAPISLLPNICSISFCSVLAY